MKIEKEITLALTSFRITGIAYLQLWGGNSVTIDMKPTTILATNSTIPSDEELASCINDNGFGCETITEAEINLYAVYGTHEVPVCNYLFVKEGTEFINQGE
jgi:hypothetical protein